MPRMAQIPTRDTAPERALRAALGRLGVGPIAANDAGLRGSPDVVLPAHRTVLFAHGCFWHHHEGCPHARIPATTYPWRTKFADNRRRDIDDRDTLLRDGWRVGWLWECALVGRDALPVAELDEALHHFLRGTGGRFIELAGLGRPAALPSRLDCNPPMPASVLASSFPRRRPAPA